MPLRRTLLQNAAWAAALGAGSGVWTAATVPAVGRPSRLVAAHYYPWYGPESHWDEGYVGTPRLGEYDSGSVTLVREHMRMVAQSAGIVFVAAGASGGTMAQHEIAVDAGTTVMASPPDAGIQPDAGIAQIREDPDSNVVTDAADVTAALRSAAPTDRSGQTQLSDGW
jgi:hypothetical protein